MGICTTTYQQGRLERLLMKQFISIKVYLPPFTEGVLKFQTLNINHIVSFNEVKNDISLTEVIMTTKDSYIVALPYEEFKKLLTNL